MKDTIRFQKKLANHKKLIASMGKTKNGLLLIPIKIAGIELALAYSNFKCEKPNCGEEKELQVHHIIQNHNALYTDRYKFLSQRHYWANILILCNKHHAMIEGREATPHKSIPMGKIEKMKQKYEASPKLMN